MLLLGDLADECEIGLEIEGALVEGVPPEVFDFSVVFKHRLIVGLGELKEQLVVRVQIPRWDVNSASPWIQKVHVGVGVPGLCGAGHHPVKPLENVLYPQLSESFKDFKLKGFSVVDEVLADWAA